MAGLINKASAALSNELVLVTGTSGFLGTQVTLEFLRAGYKVRGTFRSQAKADDWKKAHGSAGLFESAIVEDVAAQNALDAAMDGVTIVAHTASPFHFNFTDAEKEMLTPAYNGTMNALTSANKSGKVHRFVVTSSFAAILDLTKTGPEVSYSSADWNPATRTEAAKSDNPAYVYCASKKIAEEACWEFQKKEKPSFDITAINPPMIFGPPEQELKSLDSLNTSAGAIWGVVGAKEVPPVGFPVWVDVRDVSKLHLLAVTKDVARNQRYLCTAGYYTNDAIVDILKRNFPDQAHRLPAHNPDNLDTSGKAHFSTDSSKVRQDLGIEFIGLEQSVVDTATKLFAVEKKLKA